LQIPKFAPQEIRTFIVATLELTSLFNKNFLWRKKRV